MIANIFHTITFTSLCLLGISFTDAFAASTPLSMQLPKSLIFVFAHTTSSLGVFKDSSSFIAPELQQNLEVTSSHSSGLQRLIGSSISKYAPDTNRGIAFIGSLLLILPTQPLALDTISEQQVILFVRRSDATSSMEVKVFPPSTQVEMPNWLVVIYNQLERDLGRMERFIRKTQRHKKAALDVLPSLVREYQSRLQVQNQLFDQAVENNN
jgi:hypothetical protein